MRYDNNQTDKNFTFFENIKTISIFDDTIFACSDKRAMVFTKEYGIRSLCSILSGSQVVGLAVDRVFLLRSVIDSKGTQSLKVSSSAQLSSGQCVGSVSMHEAELLFQAFQRVSTAVFKCF